ncbi:hypothetical protein GOV13_00425 [Candidatus Pacearchaeota archaeon]|nr:hypothetical protein [Candidatus Pacearchaeota archaeon]
MRDKRAQVTVFIIIAIVLVGGIIVYFTFRDSLGLEGIPANLEPVYTSFLSCLEGDTLVGIDILESQAGYITLPDFELGSEYMPFSSQLNFLGNSIPYWYYVSGNNLQREQVPSKREMERQLGEFIDNEVRDCIFEGFYEQGFEIVLETPATEIDIRDNDVRVNLNMDLSIKKGEDSVVVRNHKIDVRSDLGVLYDSAIEIYEYEQENLFLEEYAVDTLRLYAPVDGVELTCSPMTWSGDKVFDELQEAIEVNTLALKVKGGDYSLNKKENEYFVIDVPVEGDVGFINSKEWPASFEVAPSEGNILMASPIGNQPGLGALGFCYVPYHFVYNVKYLVLVQIFSSDTLRGTGEIFQFPLAVVLQGNVPREALDTSAVGFEDSGLCEYKNIGVEVNTYDVRLNHVPADISYECFNEVCSIGSTTTNPLVEEFPQCVNGRIVAKAEGFENAEYVYSTTESGSVDIILDRLYELDIELKLEGSDYSKNAIVNFISDDSSKTVVYPDQKSVELSEGQYEVQVQVYRNSSIKLDAMTREQCMEVPQTGVGGLFGLTKEQCFNIDIPAQVISNALAGGGNENYYVLENELAGSSVIEINAESLPTPVSLENLQDNYFIFETKGLEISFR